MKIKKNVFSFLFIALSIFFMGCYSKYPTVITSFRGISYNPPKTQAAFYFGVTAYLRAKGITAFPDGGIPNYVLVNNGAYIYDLKSKKLQKILDCGNNKRLFSNGSVAKTIFKKDYILLSFQRSFEKENTSENKVGIFKYYISDKRIEKVLPYGYMPVLSPDENKILYICIKKDYKRELHLYDLITKKDEKIPAEFIYQWSPVKWLDNNNFLYCRDAKKGIWENMNIKTKKIIPAIPNGIIYSVSPDKKYLLYYAYKLNATKNMYLYDTITKKSTFIVNYLSREDYPVSWTDNENFEYCKQFIDNGYAKINDWESYNVITKKGKKIKPKDIPTSAFNISSLPPSKFGIKLQDIIKKSKSGYTKDVIQLKGSYAYRTLIIDYFQKKYGNRILKKMLDKINKHKEQLEGNEKSNFIRYSKDTVNYINTKLDK